MSKTYQGKGKLCEQYHLNPARSAHDKTLVGLQAHALDKLAVGGQLVDVIYEVQHKGCRRRSAYLIPVSHLDHLPPANEHSKIISHSCMHPATYGPPMKGACHARKHIIIHPCWQTWSSRVQSETNASSVNRLWSLQHKQHMNRAPVRLILPLSLQLIFWAHLLKMTIWSARSKASSWSWVTKMLVTPTLSMMAFSPLRTDFRICTHPLIVLSPPLTYQFTA